jgi:uncharacterized protein YciI
MPHFFVKLIGPRPNFPTDMNEAEKELMQQHFLYWKERLHAGEVVVFGPVMDPTGTYGMGVVEAADEAGARAFAAGDPAMKANCGFTCEIHPMRAVTRDTVN